MAAKKLYMSTGIAFCCVALTMIVCLTGCAFLRPTDGSGGMSAGELETRIVSVPDIADAESLNLVVRPGTVVVWLNQTGHAIQIIFPDRRVAISCFSPVNFDIMPEGLCASERLPPGSVASLCFVQPGSFAYSVEHCSAAGCAHPGASHAEGTVTVR